MIEEWLNEWRRWALGEIGPDVPRCISAEHDYASPQCWNEPEPQDPPLREWMGFRVERAVARLPDPMQRAIRVEVLTVRQPVESEEGFYDRRRRLAQLPAWQYHAVVINAKKTLALSLGLVANSIPGVVRPKES